MQVIVKLGKIKSSLNASEVFSKNLKLGMMISLLTEVIESLTKVLQDRENV